MHPPLLTGNHSESFSSTMALLAGESCHPPLLTGNHSESFSSTMALLDGFPSVRFDVNMA